MKCRHKANQTEHTYNKTKDTYKRNVYFVSGFTEKTTSFNEKDFFKYFELIPDMHPIFAQALKPFGIK